MPGASQAGTWPTKHSLLTTNYEPKSPSRRAGDRSDEKIVIVRGAQKSLKEQIQGPWSLASCNSTTAKGEKAAYCANNPRGILILAGNGNYASTTIAGGRKDANDPAMAANFGTWSVNEADKTLTLHFVGAYNPANEGRDIKLNISLSGE